MAQKPNRLINEKSPYLRRHFWDRANGGFFFTPEESRDLPVRKKEIYDGALPSGNSVMMANLLRLGRLSAKPEYEEMAEKIASAFAPNVTRKSRWLIHSSLMP